MPSTSNSIELNSTSLTLNSAYLVYVDRLGTSSSIRRNDSIYGNREGFYGMAPLYVEPYEVLTRVLGKRFKYFGFSDTIIAVSHTHDAMMIGTAASEIFAVLLSFSVPCRVFITQGDFSFHRFEQIAEKEDTFLCPIYGSTLLDAYQMDQLGMKCLGVFAHKNVISQFEIMPNVKFADESEAGFLNLNKYLSDSEISKLKYATNSHFQGDQGAIALHCRAFGSALSGQDVIVKISEKNLSIPA